MTLPFELHQRIRDFLLSLTMMENEPSQRAIIRNAGLDEALRQQLEYAAPAVFVPHLLERLVKFGALDDGRNPLAAVLEEAKQHVGQDKQAYCATLIDAARQCAAAPSPETPAAPCEPSAAARTAIAGNVAGPVLSGNFYGTVNIGNAQKS